MFSAITNIYNKKTKGPTLMELFTATGKPKKCFLTTTDVRCLHHGWHGTHRYDIQVLATHTSTWVHCSTSSSTVNWRPLDFCLHRHPVSVNCIVPRTNDLVCRRVFCVLCTKCTLHSNHRPTRVIFQHTKRLLPTERPFCSLHTLASSSGRNVNYDEKQLTREKNVWVVSSTGTDFVNTWPTVFF
jgi:hypothetical protein